MNAFARRIVTLVITAVCATSVRAAEPMNAAELLHALDRLETVGSALYIAAHPDDENTAMLSWLASGRNVRTGYLSLTRGDGGQNLIGNEIGPALGVIRTNELLEARRIDTAEQFFTRAVDFGYSKSPEETFRNWDRNTILSDVVWIIRRFRPDILITRFPTDGSGGHGQHTASALLALEAFDAAGDPTRFPEQLGSVTTWQPKRIFWNTWNPSNPSAMIRVDLGAWDPLLGRSYGEIAGLSRSQHKSQGFGAAERRGTTPNFLRLEKGVPATGDPFEGIDLTWHRLEGGAEIARLIKEARSSFDPRNPSAVVPALLKIRSRVAAMTSPEARAKREEIDRIVLGAAGVWLEAISPAELVTPGETLEVEALAIQRGTFPVGVRSVRLFAFDGRANIPIAPADSGAQLERNVPRSAKLAASVPTSLPVSEPYWLRNHPLADAPAEYPEAPDSLRGLPVAPPPFIARFELDFGGEILSVDEPVQQREIDRVRGEVLRLTRLVPRATVSFDETLFLFTSRGARQVTLTITNRSSHSATKGALRFEAPAGWKVQPASLPFDLAARTSSVHEISVEPPATRSSGTLNAAMVLDGHTSPARTLQRIDYEHITSQVLLPHATVRVVRTDVEHTGTSIGYIEGSGDEGARALSEIGFDVTILDDAQILRGDLSRFDTIVTGVRAFNARESARRSISRLHAFVREGGTLVVQYNTADRTLATDFPPVPITLGRGRVTEENAAVTFASSDDPLLTTPNRLTAADFEGWVQERGLYFGETWDQAYAAPLAMADTGEEPLRGSVLRADYGKGTFIYTGLSFFRQFPAGVPGSFRLFANLVSAGVNDDN